MNKEDIIKLYKTIILEKEKGSVKFRYSLLRNNNVIKDEIEALMEIENEIDKVMEPFKAEQNELIRKLGELDAATNSYKIDQQNIEKIKEYNEKLKLIEEKHKELIKEYNEKYGEYLEMLKEELEVPFEFLEIAIEDCPENLETSSIETLMKLEILK